VFVTLKQLFVPAIYDEPHTGWQSLLASTYQTKHFRLEVGGRVVLGKVYPNHKPLHIEAWTKSPKKQQVHINHKVMSVLPRLTAMCLSVRAMSFIVSRMWLAVSYMHVAQNKQDCCMRLSVSKQAFRFHSVRNVLGVSADVGLR
jgi:hypothetical protein